MRVSSLNNCNTPVSFRAIKVAQVSSATNLSDVTSIYKIEYDKDFNFCKSLLDNLLQSNSERMQVNTPKIKTFLRNAFSSFEFSDFSAIGVRNNKPFGLLSVLTYNADTEAHLGYLATWKSPDLVKFKNGGSDLINFLFNKYQDKNNINLTPAFDSELFYYKFGFDYENEYERNKMSIFSNDIKNQLKVFSKKFIYKKFDNSPSEDLESFVTFG